MPEQKADKYLFDLHDFSNEHNILDKLKELKGILPNLKVNLFTIPFQTSLELLRQTDKEKWIRMIPHGFWHKDNYECAEMRTQVFEEKLNTIPYLDSFYDKGFCAPGWQISEQCLDVLKARDWWLATQWADGRLNGDPNGPYQPAVIPGLKYYAWREYPNAIHGHTWECCGNGLETLWQKLINLPKDAEFLFIEDYVKDFFS